MSPAIAISTTEFGRGFAPEQDHALTATHPEDPAVAETFVVWLHARVERAVTDEFESGM